MSQPKRYFGSCTFSNGKVDMGRVKLLEDVTTFAQLVKEVIADSVVSNLTRAQFLALPKKDSKAPNDQSRAKQIAYIVPGAYAEDVIPRDGSHIPPHCNLIILDIDAGANGTYPAKRFVEDPQQLSANLAPYAFVAYQTASSTSDAPKLRVIVSADHIPHSEYGTAVHFIAGKLGLQDGDFDKVSTEVTRAMYRPVAYRGEQVDPILEALPEGQDVTEVDISDTEAPVKQRQRRTNESDDIEFLRTPLDGFSIADASDALSHVDADCGYNQWLEICMALKHQFPREPEASMAFEVFETWSSSAKKKYEGRDVVKQKWDAVNTTAKGRAPRTIRSLIFFAEEGGWSSAVFSKRSFETVQSWITSPDRSATELVAEGLKKIAGAHLESPVERDILIGCLQKRLTSFKQSVSKVVLKKQLDILLRQVKKTEEKDLTTMPESQMPPWARGIVYVSDTNDFYHRATDRTWSPDSLNNTFNVHLGIEPETGKAKIESKDFLLNLVKIPRVSNYQYDPQHFDSAIVKIRGKRFINTYQASYPTSDPSAVDAGDVVMQHIRNLVRETEYQTILIDFLAYHVQQPGRKIRWAPVIQGTQGCGKTALFSMMQGVLGQENAKSVNAETVMNSGFTSWATGAQLRAIEEVRVVGENRHAIMNKIKPYITNGEIEINKKFKDEVSIPNCTNYIMFTNHHDALAVQEGDRRYFVLQSAMQTKAQVMALGEDYFAKLFHAIESKPAGIRAWLEAWTISPSFNPDGHAPETKYLKDMVDAASSPLSACVRELLGDADHPLVNSEIISSMHLATAVKQVGMSGTPSTLGAILRELGYEKAGRMRLGGEQQNIWVKQGHSSGWEQFATQQFSRIGAQHFEPDIL